MASLANNTATTTNTNLNTNTVSTTKASNVESPTPTDVNGLPSTNSAPKTELPASPSSPTAAVKSGGGSSPTAANQPPPPTPVAPALNGSVKGPKPRPLKLPSQNNAIPAPGHGSYSHHQNLGYMPYNQTSHHPHNETMATDELLELMENINRAVKASQFSPTLAGQIFRLYNQLKSCGEILEQTQRNELNRVFVSLRQACCRDSGQLGTPCRLKMMELVELRAMGWRPNLAHSQYYLTRSTNGFMPPDLQTGDAMTGGELEQLGAAPVSAPPFGAMSINPFAFNIPAPMPTAADMGQPYIAANHHGMGQAPSYYLIPASHVGHPQAGITFVAPSSTGAMISAPPPMHHPVTATYSTPAVLSPMNMPNASPPINFPKGAATKPSGKYSRPTNITSFLVPQGAKERMLTVTGPTEESIIQSKILIEDTIRRNVSPVRPEGAEGELSGHMDDENRSKSDGDSDEVNPANHENGDVNNETECALAELGSILKLSCSDPAVLQAARQALSEYFHRHEPLRRSATDAFVKQTHKERRKSMPLPMLANVTELVEPESPVTKTMEDLDPFNDQNPNLNMARKFSARSTPNLAAGERPRNLLRGMASIRPTEDTANGNDDDAESKSICRVVYTRDFLLQCAASANSKVAPSSMPTIVEQINEIIPTSRETFDPTTYKQKSAEFKQGRF